MARWTMRQEEIIRECGHLGVDAVRAMIAEKCGVVHSPHAIEMHAHRIHASLRERKVCPECGTVGAPLNQRTGLCDADIIKALGVHKSTFYRWIKEGEDGCAFPADGDDSGGGGGDGRDEG